MEPPFIYRTKVQKLVDVLFAVFAFLGIIVLGIVLVNFFPVSTETFSNRNVNSTELRYMADTAYSFKRQGDNELYHFLKEVMEDRVPDMKDFDNFQVQKDKIVTRKLMQYFMNGEYNRLKDEIGLVPENRGNNIGSQPE